MPAEVLHDVRKRAKVIEPEKLPVQVSSRPARRTKPAGGLTGGATAVPRGAWEWPAQQCRAPLKSGRLCPRWETVRCPFHGRIIPRDETGQPLDPAAAEAAGSSKDAAPARRRPTVATWEAIAADVSAALGTPSPPPASGGRRGRSSGGSTPPSALADVGLRGRKRKPATSVDRLHQALDKRTEKDLQRVGREKGPGAVGRGTATLPYRVRLACSRPATMPLTLGRVPPPSQLLDSDEKWHQRDLDLDRW